MGKLINTALVFIGGMTAGGYCVVNVALKSETFTTALKDAIGKKAVEVVYGATDEQTKRKVSYDDVFRDRRSMNLSLENCDDLIFETRKDAERALDAMADIVKQYGVVSLADVYDIVGRTTTTYAVNKYGWRSVDDGRVVRCRVGYYIKLPKAEEIK